jgi:hypothetical protein
MIVQYGKGKPNYQIHYLQENVEFNVDGGGDEDDFIKHSRSGNK